MFFETKCRTSFVCGKVENPTSLGFHYKEFLANKDIELGAGAGVRVCILGTGCPEHPVIRNIGDTANIGPSEYSADSVGHTYVSAGIISSNNSGNLKGLAPQATLLLAKVTDDEGFADMFSLSTGILWGLIRKADIIVIPFSVVETHEALTYAITKATKLETLVIMEAGSTEVEGEVLYTSVLPDIDKQFTCPYTKLSYCSVNALNFKPALLGGIAALAAEKRKKNKESKVHLREYVTELIKGKQGISL